MNDLSLTAFADKTATGIADACTRCGDCVTICPVAPHAGVADIPPERVVGGILEVLRGDGEMAGAAEAWAGQCDGCGKCIPACSENINPRQMLMLAMSKAAVGNSKTPQLFRKMSRSIRLMAAMQLAPAEMTKLLRPPRARQVPVVFYTGCNAIKTPHLLFNAMYALDAIEVDYEVLGGPAACCGIIHTKWEGKADAGGKVTNGTLNRFGDFQPDRVLSWCPSCQLHIGETLSDYRRTEFAFEHVTAFLLEHQDKLRRQYRAEVPLNILLHAHEGMADLGENVAALLRDLPGLSIAGIAWESGYTCGGSGADRSPTLKAVRREATVDWAKRPEIDALVSLYHGCHGQLATLTETIGKPVVNFTDLLVRALGGEPHKDALDGWRIATDWHALAADRQAQLRANGMELEPDWLADVLPDVFAGKEFAGGLDVFAKP